MRAPSSRTFSPDKKLFLANDTDAEGDAVTLAAVGDATGGRVALDGNGDIVFTPSAGFNGAAGFTYTATDGADGATGAVTVNVAAVNDAPVATGDAKSASEDTPVTILATGLLANDTDLDGDALTITSVGNASGGTAAIDGNGNVLFTPTADFNGTASFDYTASDGQGGASTAKVTVSVAAANDAPMTAADTVSTDEDTPVTVSIAALLGNDSDVDGDALGITAVGNAVGGTVSLGGGGVTFTPTANFNGTGRFDYTASDGAASVTQ